MYKDSAMSAYLIAQSLLPDLFQAMSFMADLKFYSLKSLQCLYIHLSHCGCFVVGINFFVIHSCRKV